MWILFFLEKTYRPRQCCWASLCRQTRGWGWRRAPRGWADRPCRLPSRQRSRWLWPCCSRRGSKMPWARRCEPSPAGCGRRCPRRWNAGQSASWRRWCWTSAATVSCSGISLRRSGLSATRPWKIICYFKTRAIFSRDTNPFQAGGYNLIFLGCIKYLLVIKVEGEVEVHLVLNRRRNINSWFVVVLGCRKF